MSLTYDRPDIDTIAAVATAASESGIGIVRISGSDAGSVIEQIFRKKASAVSDVTEFSRANCTSQNYTRISICRWKANTIHYGFIADPETGEILDEVLVSWMKAPHSYTTEDTAEINTHGGIVVIQRVLDAVLRAGARPAEPGEFTKRAFLSGRIDLSEAEGVMNLIHAQSEYGRRTALAQVQGSVSHRIQQIRDRILHEIAFIESALDDPDNYSTNGYPARLDYICEDIYNELRELLTHSEEGEIRNLGIQTVIVGRPNVGKSSLMNLLAGCEKAIVTDVPGTTRDVLETSVYLSYQGGKIRLNLMDTAGIHDSTDTVEQIGVQRALYVLDQAQLVLFVIDGSTPLEEEDILIAGEIRRHHSDISKCIILANKMDLGTGISDKELQDLQSLTGYESNGSLIRSAAIHFSCYDRSGVNELITSIGEMFHFGLLSESDELIVSGERQKSEIRNAMNSLSMVRDSICDGMSEDFYSIDLMNSYSALGRIIGESVEDDLIDKIFSEFCLGK